MWRFWSVQGTEGEEGRVHPRSQGTNSPETYVHTSLGTEVLFPHRGCSLVSYLKQSWWEGHSAGWEGGEDARQASHDAAGPEGRRDSGRRLGPSAMLQPEQGRVVRGCLLGVEERQHFSPIPQLPVSECWHVIFQVVPGNEGIFCWGNPAPDPEPQPKGHVWARARFWLLQVRCSLCLVAR